MQEILFKKNNLLMQELLEYFNSMSVYSFIIYFLLYILYIKYNLIIVFAIVIKELHLSKISIPA